MNPEAIFNDRIQEFLNEGTEGNNAQLIHYILDSNPYYKTQSYYAVLDDFCFRLGLGFFVQEIVDAKDISLGYVPMLKYYNDNLLLEAPREEPVNSKTPIPEGKAYRMIAK